MSDTGQIQFDYYWSEAELLIAEGKLQDALWSYETGLVDPRLSARPELCLKLAIGMGEVQLRLLSDTPEQQTTRAQLDHTVSILRRSLPNAATGQGRALQMLLARMHCKSFEIFGEQRDLLATHLLVDKLSHLTAPDHPWQTEIRSIRQRLDAAQRRSL